MDACIHTAVGRDQAAIEGRRHFLALDGSQIEGKKGIVGHGGRGELVARGERRFDNEFLHDDNGLELCRALLRVQCGQTATKGRFSSIQQESKRARSRQSLAAYSQWQRWWLFPDVARC